MTVALGIALCECAGNSYNLSVLLPSNCPIFASLAFTLALSMNVQQYALTSYTPTRRCCSKERVWLIGLSLYVLAQFFFVGGLSYAPLSIMSACFATVLVFDALIARCVLRKKLLPTDFVGIVVILLGIVLCAIYGPAEEYALTAELMNTFFVVPSGYSFCICLLLFGTAMGEIVRRFERKYPEFRAHKAAAAQSPKAIDSKATADGQHAAEQLVAGLPPTPVGSLNAALANHSSSGRNPRQKVSAKLEMIMMVVYPVTLAAIECAAQVVLKGWTGMIAHALYTDTHHNVSASAVSMYATSNNSTLNSTSSSPQEDEGSLEVLVKEGAAVFWSLVATNAVCVALIVVWLRKVYSKFETSECLPIEYGIQTVLSITAGLTLYQEHQYIDLAALVIVYCGALCVLFGIGIMLSGKQPPPDPLAPPVSDAGEPMELEELELKLDGVKKSELARPSPQRRSTEFRLLSHGAREFIEAAEAGDVVKVTRILTAADDTDEDFDVNVQSKYGHTALHLAVRENHFELVRLLVDADADLEIRDNGGETALLAASGMSYAVRNDKSMAEYLLRMGADVEAKDMIGRTALVCAASNGHPDLVHLLLESDADLGVEPRGGSSALIEAVCGNHIEVARMLLRGGGVVDRKTWRAYLTRTRAVGALRELVISTMAETCEVGLVTEELLRANATSSLKLLYASISAQERQARLVYAREVASFEPHDTWFLSVDHQLLAAASTMFDALLVKNVPEPVTIAALPKDGMLVGHGETIDSAGSFWSREKANNRSQFHRALSNDNPRVSSVFSVICVTRDVLADHDLMHAVQRSKNDSVFNTICVKAMVSYHWNSYGRFYFFLDLWAYICCIGVMIWFAVRVQERLDDSKDDDYVSDTLSHILAAAVLTFTLYFLWNNYSYWVREILQKKRSDEERRSRGAIAGFPHRARASFLTRAYYECVAVYDGTIECLSDPWYFLSSWTTMAVFALVAMHFRAGAGMTAGFTQLMRHVNVVATLLVCLQLLSFLRGEDTLGPYITLLAKVFWDIIPFFAVILVVLFSFGVAMYLLLMNQEPLSERLTALTMLDALSAAYETDEFLNGSVLFVVLSVLAVLIAGIVINNLFVSILSDTYDKWRALSVTERQSLRATLIVQARNRRETFGWLRRMMLRAAVSESSFNDTDHGFMTILLPIDSDSDSHMWNGRLSALQRHVDENNDRLNSRIEKLQDKLSSKIDLLVKLMTVQQDHSSGPPSSATHDPTLQKQPSSASKRSSATW